MTSPLKSFIDCIESRRKRLVALSKKQKQIHSQSERDSIKKLAECYFSEVRPAVIPNNKQTPSIAQIDSLMQKLLELSHRKCSPLAYSNTLASAKRALIQLEISEISASAVASAPEIIRDVDQQIASTLDSILPSASSAYRQALTDMHQETRMSWRGPATDLREAMRETLDYLAPDKEVTAMPGYKAEPNTSGPTMKQKVRFILKKRDMSKGQIESTEVAVAAIDEMLGAFVRSVYTRSSVSTHTATSRDEVIRIRDLVRVVLQELLEIRK